MMLMGMMAASAVPVPPARAPILDYRIECKVLGEKGVIGKVIATTTARSAVLVNVNVRSDMKDIPTPYAGASGAQMEGTVYVNSRRGDVEYKWAFKLSAPPTFSNGHVVVSSLSSSGVVRDVATGLCSVISSKASYQ